MAVDSSILRQQVEEYAAELFSGACEIMAGYAEQEAPVDTGATRDAVVLSPGSGGPPVFSATLSVDTPQAAFTDEGTGPHVIEGNPFLSFEIGGKRIVVRSVNHPGSMIHKGWFSERIATDARWAEALQSAQF